jgi:hypothetical protein
VGSYGVPAGLGLGALARKLTSWTQGFHDNEIGNYIEFGLHAMAIDEERRAFPATSWVTKEEKDRAGVEQVWFAGAHSNVGGGYKESGLSDMALLWMISRVAELTGLEFDDGYIKEHFWPCAACSLYRSNRGWLISSLWPFRRPIPAHLKDPAKGEERLVNAKVHWSVKQRHGRSGLVDQKKYLRYAPKNLPRDVDHTETSQLESDYINLCRGDPEHRKRKGCALYRKLPAEQGLLGRWRTRKQRRFLDEWAKDLPG